MSKKKMRNRYESRRQFLIGSGQFMLSLPALVSMMPDEVLAQAIEKKVRVITGVSKYGINPGPLYPSESISLTPYAEAPFTEYRPFADMANNVSYMVNFNHEAFSGLAPKMNMIRGLNLISNQGNYFQGSHGFTVLSGSYSGSESPKYGASIDTIIERQLGVRAIRLKSHSRDLKVQGFSFWRPSPSAPFSQSSHIFGDKALFNTLFPNGTAAPPAASTGKKALFADLVLGDLNSLLGHRRISQSDKQKLDEYVTSVHEVQKRIIANESQTVACGEASINFEQTNSNVNYERLYENYSELISLALQCDQVRVVHMANSAVSSSYAGDGASNSVHHKANSNETEQAQKKMFFLHQMAKLAKKLDAVVDPLDPGGNTLLDNTIMLWTADLGAWDNSHAIQQIPAITFGSGGGYFKTGNFVDYRMKPIVGIRGGTGRPFGRPYKQLLISMMKSAGLSESQYINFGDGSGFGEFSTSVDSRTHPNGYAAWAGEHNNPLPFLSLK